ncbi:MAG: dihydropteroate synthase, partial [Vicinamibacteria bacterium]
MGPQVMGVLNVTPDSFSDGGAWSDADAAVAHGRRLLEEGADVLDVGGESTRPGAEPVGIDVELARVVPVIERLAPVVAGSGARLSVDTRHAEVARAALAAGAVAAAASGRRTALLEAALLARRAARLRARLGARLARTRLRLRPQHERRVVLLERP